MDFCLTYDNAGETAAMAGGLVFSPPLFTINATTVAELSPKSTSEMKFKR